MFTSFLTRNRVKCLVFHEISRRMMSNIFEAKICLLGDSGVGKSSLAARLVHNTFNNNNESTIGASFMTTSFLHLDTTFKLNIWDTAGQEMYRALAPMYYRQARVCIVVYDVTQQSTFRSLQSWVRELQTHLTDGVVIAIAANKTDLKDSRVVSEKDGREYAQSIGAVFMETSAKSAQNVRQLFVAIAAKLLTISAPKRTESTGIAVKETVEESRGKCC
ncbi:ras-related protein Rab-22A-like [Oppia nitens]|uniref:ras-related protein Rab-22A-like n=1 Tax=Oppia nitens TaxID=1686743 RepID=UPI0023DB37E5|nr:ras-related protein Rab-22A-like [Oppia nitens]